MSIQLVTVNFIKVLRFITLPYVNLGSPLEILVALWTDLIAQFPGSFFPVETCILNLPLLRLQLHLKLLFSRQIMAWQNCTAEQYFKRTIYHCCEIKTGNINDVQATANLKCLFRLVKMTLEIALYDLLTKAPISPLVSPALHKARVWTWAPVYS